MQYYTAILFARNYSGNICHDAVTYILLGAILYCDTVRKILLEQFDTATLSGIYNWCNIILLYCLLEITREVYAMTLSHRYYWEQCNTVPQLDMDGAIWCGYTSTLSTRFRPGVVSDGGWVCMGRFNFLEQYPVIDILVGDRGQVGPNCLPK